MYSMLISKNYKNVHSGHDHDLSWEQSHINYMTNPSCNSVPTKQCIPACYHRTSLQGTDIGQLHDWGIQPELKPCLDMITKQIFKFSWSGKACLHRSVWFNSLHLNSAKVARLPVKYHCHANNICILSLSITVWALCI